MPKQNPHEHDEIAPGTMVDGRYKIVRTIGQGGNGMVYEVEHARTGRMLALKALLDETGFARLEQEARAASMMKNGHTAKIIDMEAGGPTGAYMVMELLDGQSLRALLDDAGQLPLELTINIAMQVCECLHEAHGLGIIHRDLKPENVFLCQSPWPGQYDVKVLDFGVMKIADGGGAIPKSSLTRTGSTVGTPYYMSLEQLRNSSAVDARADVYSLGVVLYECLSGRKPFQADTIGDLVYALCSGPPTQLARLRPDLPADMAEMVMRTLSANRDDRPASMLDLAVALLPTANPAFALWVKVDGKQPALGRGPAPAGGEGAPRPKAPAAPRPTAHTLALDALPAAQARGGIGQPPSSGGGGGGVPRPGARAGAVQAPVTPPNDADSAGPEAAPQSPSAWDAPRAKQGWPAPPEKKAEAGGRRDTPTEMYVKGVHGSAIIEAPDEGLATGDRDTPTKAYTLESIQRPAGPASMETMKSAGPLEDALAEPSTMSLRDATQQVPPAGDAPGFGAAPASVHGAALQPGATTAKLTIPLGEFLRHLPPEGGAPAPPASGPGTQALGPPKPRWQEKVDRALISVGRSSERQLQRYREAPQNTQIIVMIVGATIAILLLGFVLFLAVH